MHLITPRKGGQNSQKMTIFDWIFYKVPERNCFRLLARNARYEHPHMEGGKGEESIRSVWTRDVSEHMAEIFQAPSSSLWKSRDLELWKLQLAVSKSSYCYNKDCWKSKGFLSYFALEPLAVITSFLLVLRFSVCINRGGRQKQIMCSNVCMLFFCHIYSFHNEWREWGSFGAQFIKSTLSNCMSMIRFLLQKCYL